jgi:hypothetical protein
VFDDAAAQEKRWHMPIPDYQTLMLAVLRILGNSARIRVRFELAMKARQSPA